MENNAEADKIADQVLVNKRGPGDGGKGQDLRQKEALRQH